MMNSINSISRAVTSFYNSVRGRSETKSRTSSTDASLGGYSLVVQNDKSENSSTLGEGKFSENPMLHLGGLSGGNQLVSDASNRTRSIESDTTNPESSGTLNRLSNAMSFVSSEASKKWKDTMFAPRFTDAINYRSTVKHIDNAAEEMCAIQEVRSEYYSSSKLDAPRLEARIAGCVRRGRNEDFVEIISMIKAYSAGGSCNFAGLAKNKEALQAIQRALTVANNDSSMTSDKKNAIETRLAEVNAAL